ncbi:hypothetical protein OE88DRAFT_453255 [Heliocybe sulcata]|uniref:Transferase family protein n=1 Tax=Heliocybe sulcata TaxID=5364 RepID=A0A5C3MVW6_9AGAM|nr:hypothetical protein OE88DRAFT_453255 [Heliocybe sulcata]
MSSQCPLGVVPVSRTTIFPSQNASRNPTGTPLSILDSRSSNWAPTAAFWVYDRPDQFATDLFVESLRLTLGMYPHWTGEVCFVDPIDVKDHRYRFRRLQVKYGFATDPGVDVIIAESDASILHLIPGYALQDAWDASALPSAAFIPDDALPPMAPGKPAALVQFTTFADAFAIGVKLAHGLADAHTLVQFMRDWMNIHRRVPVTSAPLFDPTLLDRAAAGDIDSEGPDKSLLRQSLALPILRYDYWASASGAHPFMAETIRVPDQLDKEKIRPFGTPLPWHEWDVDAPVAQYVICFTSDEVHKMWLDAVAGLSHAERSASISHLDALLAFVWMLINRARGLAGDEQPVHLSTILGLRNRLVPANFIGSPVIHVGVTCSGREAASANNLRSIAWSIRTVINSFTSDSLGALLHDMAYEDTPHREWNGFFGRHHVIFTSWLRLGLYEMEFVEGVKPRFASSVMPAVDGVISMTEGLPARQDESTDSAEWWKNGIDVSLQLTEKAMDGLLADPLLRSYRSRNHHE